MNFGSSSIRRGDLGAEGVPLLHRQSSEHQEYYCPITCELMTDPVICAGIFVCCSYSDRMCIIYIPLQTARLMSELRSWNGSRHTAHHL